MGAWTGFGTKKTDSTAETGKDVVLPTTSAVRQGLTRMGTWAGKKPEVDDEEDDRQIRFKIGGAGRRLTKDDFLNEIRSLDPKARAEIVKESDAPAPMKERAARDADDNSPGSGRLFAAGASPSASKVRAAEPLRPEAAARRRPDLDEESDDDQQSPATRRPIRVGEPSSSASSSFDDVPESAAERRRRQQALKGVDDESPSQRGRSEKRAEYDPETQESAAEKRRREAALGLGDTVDDSDDDDTPRVPPPVAKSRGIRFAQSPVRAKK